MSNSNEDTRLSLRRLGEYLIEASSSSDDIDDALTNLAVPLPTESAGRVNIDDSLKLGMLAKREYEQRARRHQYFATNLFADPAWDILLDLYISKISGIRISITSACIASQVPPTTALRWIRVLEIEGYLVRAVDSEDNRRSWLELSELGTEKMNRYFRELHLRMNNVKEYSFSRRVTKNTAFTNMD